MIVASNNFRYDQFDVRLCVYSGTHRFVPRAAPPTMGLAQIPKDHATLNLDRLTKKDGSDLHFHSGIEWIHDKFSVVS